MKHAAGSIALACLAHIQCRSYKITAMGTGEIAFAVSLATSGRSVIYHGNVYY
jgi:hypothetical protein